MAALSAVTHLVSTGIIHLSFLYTSVAIFLWRCSSIYVGLIGTNFQFVLFCLNFLAGEEIVAGDDIYGGSDRLLSQVIPRTGIVVKLVSHFLK